MDFWYSFCGQLSPPVFLHINSSDFVFIELQSPSVQLRMLSSFWISLLWSGNCHQAMTWNSQRAHFVGFSFLQDHCCVLLIVQCLKSIVTYIWSIFLVVLVEGKPRPSYLILLKEEVFT